MKFENNELVFILGAVDGVRCQNTEEVRVKAQILSLVAVELENRQKGVKVDVGDTDTVSDE